MSSRGLKRRAAIALVAAGAFVLGTLPAQATPPVKPIAEGFVGPLGLAVDKHGTFYVSESFAQPSKITAVTRKGKKKTVVTAKEGSINGVAVDRHGKLTYTVTISPPSEGPPVPGTQKSFVYRAKPKGKPKLLASTSAFEAKKNPDKVNKYGFLKTPKSCLKQLPPDLQPYRGQVDSNAYAVALAKDGSTLVADAGGNTILRITPKGRIKVVAVLPPIKQGPITQELIEQAAEEFGLQLPTCLIGQFYWSEPVPTDVEIGPDGRYYVSTLPGFPELPGTGKVWKINPKSGKISKVAGGFSGAVDLAVTKHGKIYVAELFGNKISKISHGKVSKVTKLTEPGAIEVGKDGKVYATANVFSPTGNGTLVKIKH